MFGKNPFVQTFSTGEPIFQVLSENISQVFGYISLKEGIRPEPIKEILKEIKSDHDTKSEEIKLLRYFRCDEGKGNTLLGLVTDEVICIR